VALVLTDDRLDAFEQAWRDNSRSRAQIAEEFGISESGASRAAARLGLPSRRGGRRIVSGEQAEAFRRDWEIGMPIKEMAALHGFKNINSVTRTARSLGLPSRRGGPRAGNGSPGVLRGGQWVLCSRRRVMVWQEAA
jgi:hypothetical protein